MKIQRHIWANFEKEYIDHYCNNYSWDDLDDKSHVRGQFDSGDILLFVDHKLVKNRTIQLW